MGIGADRLDVATHGDQAIRRAGELRPQPLHQRLHRPVLPEEGMPPPRAEIGQFQPLDLAQPGDLLPEFRHGAGIEHLQLEAAELFQDRPRAEFHQHGQRRDFPEHDLGPAALEGQLVLPIALFQVVGRQAQALEPLHEIGAEHLTLAIEGVAAQPGALPAREAEAADMVELLAQLALVDQLGQADLRRPVQQRELDRRLRPVPKDRLAHQELVEVRVDQRPDDRVDLPAVVPDTGGDIDHGGAPVRGTMAPTEGKVKRLTRRRAAGSLG